MATLDPQDPLPEVSWLWRRTFIFVCMTFSMYFVWRRAEALPVMGEAHPAEVINAQYEMFRLMMYFAIMLVTYYMVAPSAEQITKMIQVARSLREGVTFKQRVTSTDADGATATSSTTATQNSAIAAAAPPSTAKDEDPTPADEPLVDATTEEQPSWNK